MNRVTGNSDIAVLHFSYQKIQREYSSLIIFDNDIKQDNGNLCIK